MSNGRVSRSPLRRQLRRAVEAAWRRATQGRAVRRQEEARARFWSELREGEREAESRSLAERRA